MRIPFVPLTALTPRQTHIRILATAFVLMTTVLLGGCPPPAPGQGSLPIPVFSVLELPAPSGGWMTYSTSSPPPEVLPVKGRGVRIMFYAPVGSVFTVSLRALDGTITPLAENRGTPAPPDDGLFSVVDVNAALNPPLYTLYARAPLALPDPVNYDILVVNKSLRTDVMDSAAMVVALRQRKVFTVSVTVNGDGHVTSNPPGIQCGRSASGAALTDCSYEFGPGQITLAPGSNNLNTTKFIGWSGNCPAGVQVCTLTLNGMAPVSATATFGARSATGPVSSCPTAPMLPGLKWVDIPHCATGVLDSHPGITNPAVCDSAGYFCCEPGGPNSNSPRCGGIGKIESIPDCRATGIRAMLRQPGGCYEVQ